MPAKILMQLTPALQTSTLRKAIGELTRSAEPAILPSLLAQARLSDAMSEQTKQLAHSIAGAVRAQKHGSGRSGLVQGLLQEFALSSQEGVALMCLAEALLRIPDAATRDALIRDKIGEGNWHEHLGRSPSLFVNAAAWGLLLTGKLVATHSDRGLTQSLKRLLARGGEPLIRKGVDMAMRMMGEQFVTGETIEQALVNSKSREAQGFRYSYDMLGEAAMTAADAHRYFLAYEKAIHAIGQASNGRGIINGPGISIKLSALHPRYARSQVERVMAQLYPRLLTLASLARRYNIGLNIDAEESERLELSLDLLERLCFESDLAGWNGIGLVIQAYQKRCPAVVDYLIDLARRSQHRLMVRLVKGAYWDSEIKRAQVEGQTDYPVYTRKAYTDVAYLACAKKLLAAPDAVFAQFATHNAHTLAAIHTLAGPDWDNEQYEFQCLHGMGEPLYAQVSDPSVPAATRRPCRIYAPVGTHETLLAYLVRRLLENGANSSFVNRIADAEVPLDELIEDPCATVAQMAEVEGRLGASHALIALPPDLYRDGPNKRANALGYDLNNEVQLAALNQALTDSEVRTLKSKPLVVSSTAGDASTAITNPANRSDAVGYVQSASADDVERAFSSAAGANPTWSALTPDDRASRLETAADAFEASLVSLIPVLVREAGKTCANAISEVREAVDFLRYYSAEIRRDFTNQTHIPLGTVVCISPWNFPLAIFTGQIAAALAAGNTVLAKPAEQTPLIATLAVKILHESGVPESALQLLPGPGETIGASLVQDPRTQGVLFTGSTQVARLLQQSLATRLSQHGKLVPLIAETGGQNAMIVDSSALAEQAVSDIVSSAFDSAGQRCSALRALCVQEDIAEHLISMLKGAVEQLQMGDPRALSTDVGPVIDAQAKAQIESHVQRMSEQGCAVWRLEHDAALNDQGHYVAPTIIEIPGVEHLGAEVFGPVLHVIRFRREQLPGLLEQINDTGYGLTHGVHTRIDETVAQVVNAARAGNIYVNRNVVGAVVGVQPFGGEGLSGTGPKAGGPQYLLRLLSQRPVQAARLAIAHNHVPARVPLRGLTAPGELTNEAMGSLKAWALSKGLSQLAAQCDQATAESPISDWIGLAGPTGEANMYSVWPREAILCLVDDSSSEEQDFLTQLVAILAVGAHALWPTSAQGLYERLPATVRERIRLVKDWSQPAVVFDGVIHHGQPSSWLVTASALARRPGPIVSLTALLGGETDVALERLVLERSLCINTAAAGGNATLMTLS